MNLADRVAELEARVAFLEEIARAGAAYVHLRRMTRMAERDLEEAHKPLYDDGLRDFVEAHMPDPEQVAQ